MVWKTDIRFRTDRHTIRAVYFAHPSERQTNTKHTTQAGAAAQAVRCARIPIVTAAALPAMRSIAIRSTSLFAGEWPLSSAREKNDYC
jgi:hypothetical protein